MKRYIKNKMYDTSTAKLVGKSSSEGKSKADFSYTEYYLYKKRTGEYFSVSGYWESGEGWVEKLNPLSYDEAKSFAELVFVPETYEAEFNLAEEKTLTFELTAENRQKLEEIRSKTGKSFGAILNQMVEDYEYAEKKCYHIQKIKDGGYYLLSGNNIVGRSDDTAIDESILISLLEKEASGELTIEELNVIHKDKLYFACRKDSDVLNISERPFPASMFKSVADDYIEI